MFGLIARANPDFRGFSLLAAMLGLFETGALDHAAGGFFQKDAGHISRDANRMGLRLGDAMSRGKRLAQHLHAVGRGVDADLLAIDWFRFAAEIIDDVRTHFQLPPKSRRAIEANSVNPWEPGGISPYNSKLGTSVPKWLDAPTSRGVRAYERWGHREGRCA